MAFMSSTLALPRQIGCRRISRRRWTSRGGGALAALSAWLGPIRPDLLPLVQRHSRPPGSWIHEDRRARQSDRASAQSAQKADAQEWPVPGDEAAGALRETLRQAKAEAGPGQKETSQGDEVGRAPQR